MAPNSTDSYYAGAQAPASMLTSRRSSKQLVREKLTPDALGIVIVMVGLPARGKSFTSRKLERFLQWRGLETTTFNVGKYRRDGTAPEQSGRSDFFDRANVAALASREAAAFAALDDALAFLDAGGQIAILDATNSVSERRSNIAKRIADHKRGYSILFVEVLCDDTEVIDANMLNKVQHSPDFAAMTPSEALADLRVRIAKYEKDYESVRDDEGPYIKLYNLSSKVLVNHCYGRVARTVVPFTMGIHIGTRPIWLVRAGAGKANPQSPQAASRSLGLSGSGRSFAASLAKFVSQRAGQHWQTNEQSEERVRVFTSTMPRAVDSAQYVTDSPDQLSALNALEKGAVGVGWWDVECGYDVPPWEEVEQRHPEFWAKFREDPLKCRFPGGESYMDVVQRLETLLIEVEMCTMPVLIVSHLTVLQLFIAYFRCIPIEEAWKVPVGRNTVLEAVPSLGGGYLCSEYPLPVDSPAAGEGPQDCTPPAKKLRTEARFEVPSDAIEASAQGILTSS